MTYLASSYGIPNVYLLRNNIENVYGMETDINSEYRIFDSLNRIFGLCAIYRYTCSKPPRTIARGCQIESGLVRDDSEEHYMQMRKAQLLVNPLYL